MVIPPPIGVGPGLTMHATIRRRMPARMHAASCRCARCNHAVPADRRPRGCAAPSALAIVGVAVGFAIAAFGAAAHGSTVLVIFGALP